MRENVIFKGDKDGLLVVLNTSAEFGVIIKQLKAKLDKASRFFAGGAKVSVLSDNGCFSEEEQKQLICLLGEYDLSFANRAPHSGDCRKAAPAGDDTDEHFADSSGFLTEYTQTDDENQILTVPKMLRGGQKLIYSGTVVVMGNVNPSAHIIAGGDIVVRGTCWGTVHAGAFGDSRATITADRLVASQLRIADFIARSPDNFHNPPHPERARIFNGEVIIEPAAGPGARGRTA